MIGDLFFGFVELSKGQLAAKDTKLHLRGLADRHFFAALEARCLM
jgi:hypothetical protein